MNKTDTLFGGRKVNIPLLDGNTVEWTVRQFRLKEYNACFALVDDEIALVAKACDKTRAELTDILAPETYEELFKIMKEVNHTGFFPYAERLKIKGAENLRLMPEEMLERLMANNRPTSLTPSPTGPRPPV